MRTSVRVFAAPKAGNSAADYEDAHWPRQAEDCLGNQYLAVADGATETSFAGWWARLLVKSFGRGRLTPATWETELRRMRIVWQRAVGRKPLPWYAEEKLRMGAFSSLAGLRLTWPVVHGTPGGLFHAVAIGDSCVFQVRARKTIWTFPFSAASEFNSRPLLLSSLECGAAHDVSAQWKVGVWEPGDQFLLMTDALACWTMRLLEASREPLAQLQELQTQTDFENLVAKERSSLDADRIPLLKNDDVTLVTCLMG